MNSKVTQSASLDSNKFVRSLGLAGVAGLSVFLAGWLGPKLWNTTIIDLLALQVYLVSLFGTYQDAAKAFASAGLLGLLVANVAMAFRIAKAPAAPEGSAP